MKKIFLSIAIFFSIMVNVNAIIDDECIDSGKCLVLCNYRNNVNNNHKYYDLTIYYNFNDKNISVRWEDNYDKSRKYVQTKTGAVDYVFSNSGTNIYWGTGNPVSLSNFTCPANGYIDRDQWAGANELCFDNDGTTCPKNYSNMATSFVAGTSKKDYDFEEQIGYYSEWIFGDIKDDISNGKFNLATDIPNKLQKDFQQNYLYNNEMPEFILNSSSYKNILESVNEEFEKAKKEALDESEKAVENGEKTEEEHEQTKENWNVSTETIQTQVEMGFSKINMSVTWLSDFDVSDYCESYFGNPKTPGKPAYYMQFIFDLIKYAAIILLLVLTIIDFVKAIPSNNQDAIKKASNATVKRLILVFIIFMLPKLIEFLLTLLGAYSPGTCGIS